MRVGDLLQYLIREIDRDPQAIRHKIVIAMPDDDDPRYMVPVTPFTRTGDDESFALSCLWENWREEEK